MRLKTAIIGSGNIGCDILCKVIAHPDLECVLFAGRSIDSAGMKFAQKKGVRTTSKGIAGVVENIDSFDLIFDATSATAHEKHAALLNEAGKTIINLTPAHEGELCIPTLNGKEILNSKNINMITCGGQASVPIAKAICEVNKNVSYLEVVSSISDESAGPATRKNLSNYITTTENALIKFTGCDSVKAILNINPAKPNVYMQTAISALVENADVERTKEAILETVQKLQTAVPGYSLIVDPHYSDGRLFTMVRVEGAGHFLDASAGNLDIITASAIHMASLVAKRYMQKNNTVAG